MALTRIPSSGLEGNITLGNVVISGSITNSSGQDYITSGGGAAGYTGSAGSLGYTGSAGTLGIAGYTGSAGEAGGVGYTGSQGNTGLGFAIAKSYATVAALTADTAPTGITAGQFAIIETGSVNDADNSKLYLWSGTAYSYVTDLSGAAGITGPAGSTGFTGSAGSAGTNGFTGSVGSAGSAGTNGFTGSVGFVGSAGFVGSGGTGFTGSAGVFSGDTNSAVNINNSTASVSTGTGALTVAGGAGIAGSLYVGDASVISTNSASTALRITQTGAGNALVVEDSVNPDATPFVIDNAGLVGLGIALPTAKLHVTGLNKAGGILVETANTSSAAPAIEVIGKRSDGNTFAAFSGKVLLGGNRTDAAVGANKLLGAVAFGGNHTDGLLANLLYTASISGIAEGTFTDAATMPTGLAFLTGSVGTTADSTTVSMGTERMRISNAGVTTITGTAIINSNATTDALRITQIGTGNALVVEDSANPDATPFLINNAGVVISGSTSSLTGYAGSPTQQTSPIEVMGGNNAGTGLAIFGFSSATGTARATVNFNKSQSTTIGTHAIVTSDEALGAIHFSGSDGTNYIPAAQIYAHTDGTPGTNIMPGRLVFSTTAPGDNLPTERVRITSGGYVGIDTINPLVKLEVSGSNDQVWQVTASISGTTMDVTAVTTGTIAVDDLVFGINVQPYTRVTALGTGTGGIGTYTVSVFQTVASTASMFGSTGYGDNIIRITETDGGQNQGQPTGALQFFTSDNSTPGVGVGAYVAALAESTSPDTALIFGTRDNTGGGVDANERMRIGSAGTVSITTAIGATSTTTGALTVAGGIGIAGNVWAGNIYGSGLVIGGNTILSNVNVLGASYDSVFFSLAGEELTPTDLFFSPNGLKMYVTGSTGDDVNEYNLSTAWVVSSAVFVTNFSVASQETSPQGLFFRADGTKMYIVGQTNDTVFQYTLSTPWSVATASYDSISFSVAAEATPNGLWFRPNGLSMYMVGSTGDLVYQYTLSTAWNVSTATFLQSFSVSGQESISHAVTFTGDGSRMFVMGQGGDDVNVYNLTTPWDISTSAFVNVFSVAGQDVAPNGIYIKPDGTKMYIVGSTTDAIYQYTVPSIDIQLTGTTTINGSATVQQDLTVYGNFNTSGIGVTGNVQAGAVYSNNYFYANGAAFTGGGGGGGGSVGYTGSSGATGAQGPIGYTGSAGSGGGGSIGYTGSAGMSAIQEFVATEGQDTFVVSGGYTAGSVLVFVNGIQMNNNDYTAANEVSVVLTESRRAGDVVRVIFSIVSPSININNIKTFSVAMSIALGL